nr:hypothetical protein GCM10020093_040330 [Planobispora longispora]
MGPGSGAPARLVERYGSEARDVRALAERDPALAEPLPTGVTLAELVWAVRHEGRWTPRTCWTGGPGSGWSPATGRRRSPRRRRPSPTRNRGLYPPLGVFTPIPDPCIR